MDNRRDRQWSTNSYQCSQSLQFLPHTKPCHGWHPAGYLSLVGAPITMVSLSFQHGYPYNYLKTRIFYSSFYSTKQPRPRGYGERLGWGHGRLAVSRWHLVTFIWVENITDSMKVIKTCRNLNENIAKVFH